MKLGWCLLGWVRLDNLGTNKFQSLNIFNMLPVNIAIFLTNYGVLAVAILCIRCSRSKRLH